MLARSGLDTRFLLQESIELADQSSRLEAHVNRSSEFGFGRYKSADKARTKPLSLRSRLAPNHVDAFRCIPKDGPLDFDMPDGPAQGAVTDSARLRDVGYAPIASARGQGSMSQKCHGTKSLRDSLRRRSAYLNTS